MRFVAKFYNEYNGGIGVDARRCAGVTLDDLERVETVFRTNWTVYRLAESDVKPVAELVPIAPCCHVRQHHPRTRTRP